MKRLETDVIVIGGGLAGMTAALSAKAIGCSVTLVCKSLTGHSGNSIVAGSGVSVYRPGNSQNDTIDLYRRDLIRSGAGINDLLIVDQVLKASNQVVPYLEKNGVPFRYSGRELMVRRVGGHSSARFYYTDYSDKSFKTRGLSLTEPMRSVVEKAEINVMDNTTVIKLIMSDGIVCGCLCIDNKSKKNFSILAKSVILAAGGGASLFERTNNTSDVTCDSYRLALEAGAELRDMEFVQFYPCVLAYPIPLQIEGSLFADGAVLRNADGEEFMYRYSEQGNLATRDIMAIAVQSEIKAGRGKADCIYVDCSAIDEEEWKRKYKEFTRTLSNHHIDVRKDILLAAPAAHFYMGGICVDSDYSAGVPGLYACGEAVGGLHGANRLPGVALTEAVVSGRIAGRKAGEHAEGTSLLSEIQVCEIPEKKISRLDWKQKIRDLRAMAWKEVSIIRDEASIRRFEEYLDEQKYLVACVEAGGEDRHAYEYLSYYVTAQMLVVSAKYRKESRGAHFRADYPMKDEAFTGNFICHQNDDKIVVRFVKERDTK